MTRFTKTILPIVLRHEGGKVDNPRDPGGRTNMGIIQRTYNGYRSSIGKAHQDVFLIAKIEVAAIYTRDYWGKIRGAKLPHGVDLATFDSAVNSGPRQGVKWLQGALGVNRDGGMGPVTIKAVSKAHAAPVVVAMCSARMGFLRRLRHWSTFKRGWTRRVAEIEAKGVAMACVGKAATQAELKRQKKKARIKQTANETGVAGTGVGGSGMATQAADMPEWLIAVLILAGVAALAVFIIQRFRHRDRVFAYDDELKRMEKRK